MMKICARCKQAKLKSEFHKDKGKKDGLFCYCKDCHRERHQQYYQQNKKNECERSRQYYQTLKGKWTHHKYSAKKRGQAQELTFEDFRQQVIQPCRYCGASGDPWNGIDRVDNSRGYTIDNVVTCCDTCNYMKRNLSVESFLNHIKKICQAIRY